MKYLDRPQSGSQAGTTASRNRFGQYFRSRSTPVQPRTSAVLAQRARMAANAQAWRTATDAQRAGWASLGENIVRSDALGQTYKLNGFAAFCSVNNNRLAAGDARVLDAPAIASPGTLSTLTITLTNAAFSLAYTATPLGTGVRLFVYVSPQRSAGVKFNPSYFLLTVTAAAAASPDNILAAYTAKYGVPVTGTKIWVSTSLYKDGFMGSPLAIGQVVA